MYDVGGLGEIVGRYGAGAVVEPGDVGGMSLALQTLLDDRDVLAAARSVPSAPEEPTGRPLRRRTSSSTGSSSDSPRPALPRARRAPARPLRDLDQGSPSRKPPRPTTRTHAPREELEERFGDYQLVVDAIAEGLYGVREDYAATLDDDTADTYRRAFDRMAKRRFRAFVGLLEENSNVPALIEDYGLIGDLQAAALVSRHVVGLGPASRAFDSGAVFAALVGEPENGHWTIQPQGEFTSPGRRYRGDSLVLETTFRRRPARRGSSTSCRRGRRSPRRAQRRGRARASRDAHGARDPLRLRGPMSRRATWRARLSASRRARRGALHARRARRAQPPHARRVLRLRGRPRPLRPHLVPPSNEPPPKPVDPGAALSDTLSFWDEGGQVQVQGPLARGGPSPRSVTLKAPRHAPTGGITVAAPTTSCRRRSAASGTGTTATAGSATRPSRCSPSCGRATWRRRKPGATGCYEIAGSPDDVQIMYGVAGERRLVELELLALRYEGSSPVRIGNAASGQRQLDVYGEVVDALYSARQKGLQASDDA